MWMSILVFSVAAVAASPRTCPSEQFTAVFTSIIDQTIDNRTSVITQDPEFSFFKKVLNLRENAIQHIFEDAIYFFNATYGLDFSASPPNEENERFIKDAVMRPFVFFDNLDYYVSVNNWIRTGNTRSNCYRVQEGGIDVSFSSDRTLYGTYGGAEGKPVGVGDLLIYGFFRINVCEQSPVIIQCQSSTPIRVNPVDGIVTINYDLYSRVLGRGRAQGTYRLQPFPNQPDKIRLMLQNTCTFERYIWSSEIGDPEA